MLDSEKMSDLEHLANDQYQQQIAMLKQLSDRLKASDSVDSRASEELEDVIFCFEIALFYFQEMSRAWRGEAFYCAATFGAAALESFLLGFCFLNQNEIKQLPKWKTLKKSQREDFRVFARHMDLGKLLEIAQQLSWFPTQGVPNRFKEYMLLFIGEEHTLQLLAVLGDDPDIGQLCAAYLKDYRDKLHPAACLRSNFQPNKEAGMTAALLFLVAMFSLKATK